MQAEGLINEALSLEILIKFSNPLHFKLVMKRINLLSP